MFIFLWYNIFRQKNLDFIREEEILIEVKHLTKKYGPNTAVDDISFTVESGRIYGFLGPNGAGKSTTMNIICGCLSATDGEVLVDGVDIYDEPLAVRRKIGYLPEIPPLYPDMTPREYLRFIARAKKVDDVNADVDHVISLTSIDDVKDRLIRNLSKGYKQRVGIAQAILGDPEIIVLDEPTVGLDPVQIIEIRELIRELGKDHTVILSSHILPEIEAVCEYVIMIAHGKIVASDTLENLNRSLGDTEILTVEGDGSVEQMKAALDGVGGLKITGVPTPIGAKLEIETPSDRDIRRDVFKAFADAGIALVRLESNSQTLENIFVRLANEEHIAAGDAEANAAASDAPESGEAPLTDDSPYYEPKPKKKKASNENTEEYSTLFGGDGQNGGEEE